METMDARGQGMLPIVSRQFIKSELFILEICDGPMEEAASPEAIKMSHVNTTVSKEGISSKFVESGS